MKQFGIGATVLAGIAALVAFFVYGGPTSMYPSPVTASNAPNIPRGAGFDFYVLALSWSPTYCQDSQARQRDTTQCSGPRPFAFVVHGLWPQFEQGFPRACQTNKTRPTQSQARGMLDIMPSERLVQHQWEKHGTCSGLSGPDFLRVTRAAAGAIAIPEAFASAPDWRRVTAGDVEAAFVAVNPALVFDGIAIARRGNNLSEVRICLTLDLAPRPCPEINRNGAAANTRLAMPPSRG